MAFQVSLLLATLSHTALAIQTATTFHSSWGSWWDQNAIS